MRTKRAAMIKFAVVAICGLLLELRVAGATTNGDKYAQPHQARRRAAHARAGENKSGDAAFLKLLAGPSENSSYCESSCCWASCPQDGEPGGVFCSDSECQAWCPDGSFARATCGSS